ncbi:MAG: RNA-binding domain-containing protein [Candidatus Omnitrophota bacterium]|jgi:ATP-dependent DNA helicase RecG
MDPAKIRQIIKKGEGIEVEFKECRMALSRGVFDTVCAFLNRSGGELLLGVNDKGKITGVDPQATEQIKKDFVTAVNNEQKISPVFYLSIEEVRFAGKSVLYVLVPESSQVHRHNGKIFDRNEDGDFDVTRSAQLVSAMYLRKQTTYSENRVYSYVTLKDLRKDLIARIRKMAANQKANHPWARMSDLELLKSTQLYLRDYQSGKEGLTLAAVLLLGKDATILSVLPHHRTDAILRQINLDRYDDRDDVRTNLIESYDRLMAFVQKHLSDPFYLEGDVRISLRDQIFREVIANLIIHREFLNPFPAKLIIEGTRVVTENSNRPHGHRHITPANFSPYPKNPVIAKFFKQIGWADELGSGVRKLFRYGKLYSGRDPELLEADIFKVVVPLCKTDIKKETPQAEKLLEFCRKPRSREEMQNFLALKDRKYFRISILNPLIKKRALLLAIPGKPNSPKQKYYVAGK